MADDKVKVNMTREQAIAYLAAHEAASRLVAGIVSGMQAAAETIRALAASGTSENLDPYTAKIVQRFGADMQLLEVFLSFRDLNGGEISQTATPRDVLISLGMHCDWLPGDHPEIEAAVRKAGGNI